MSYDGSLKFDTKVDSTGFEKGVGTLQKAGQKSFGIITKMAKGVGLALGGIGLASMKVGSDFEAGMSEVAAISGATGKDFEALSDKAKEMGATTKFSATESAEALKYMAMAGWKTEQMLEGLPGVMHLAAASGEELGMVSDIVTDALSAFGMEASRATEFADLLASASSNSNTNVGMMGETFKYVAPVAGGLGYTAEDTALAIGLMANAGIKASQSGTALRGLMTRMAKPTKESAAAMEVLGVTMTDSAGNMKPFKTILEDIRTGMAKLSPEEQARYAAMLAGQQGMSGLMAIAGATEEEFNKLTDATRDYTGAAEEMADTMQDNLQGDIVILQSALEGLGIAISGAGEFLRGMVQDLTDIVDVIKNTLDGPAQLAAEYDELSDSLGGAQLALGGTQELMEQTPYGLEAITSAIADFINNGLEMLAEALPRVLEISGSIIEQLLASFGENQEKFAAAITEILTLLAQQFIEFTPQLIILGAEMINSLLEGLLEALPTLLESVSTAINTLMEGLTENLPQMLETGAQILLGISQGITENLPMLMETGMTLVGQIVDAIIENLPLLLEAGFNVIEGIGLGIAENLPELMTKAIEIVIAIADGIIENVDTIFEVGAEILLGLVQGLMDNLPTLIAEVPRIINELAAAIRSNFPVILKTGIEIIKTLAIGLIKAIPTLIKNIPQIIRAIYNAFMLYNWAQLGSKLLKGIGNGIKSGISGLANAAKNAAKTAVEAIKAWFRNGTTEGAGLIKNIINGIKSLASNLIGLAKELAGDAISAIKGGFSKAFDIGKHLVQGIWDGIRNAKDWLLGKVKGWADSIMGGIKGFFGIHSPSRKMRDEVGTELVRGIMVGIQEETPALREATETEMMQLVDDYALYGRKAAEAYGQLSHEELKELRKQHKDDGKALAEAIADGIEAKTDSVVQAMERLREQTIRELDKLGDATIKALESKYESERDLALDNLDKRLKIEQEASRERLDIYEREHLEKIRLLDSETNGELRALQNRIDAINDEIEAQDIAREQEEYEEKLAAAQEKVRTAKTNREKVEAEKELNKLIKDQQRKEFKRQKKEQIASLKNQMSNVKDQAKAKEDKLKEELKNKQESEKAQLEIIEERLNNERDLIENHYDELLKAEALQAEARKLILAENNDELIELLDSYNPFWMDAGQSFGESLIDGLNSMKYEIQDVVDDILSMVATVDMADAQILQAKQDWDAANNAGDKAAMDAAHRKAERYRKQGGTIGADASIITKNQPTAANNPFTNGVNQNITIVSPQNTPSENARLIKRKGEELVYGY